ncbi:DUF397 domain-containing protein [Kineosporia sp. NBRC 101731]|uniref:DUF397 domain-containing protein n=1 Tax=Kineosporia sp. NBRC 101731 TaxID=3032199 RepID=UPI0024A21E18|nr:DUF397 domain-containing protein [Kineosporia sp. NBRC 101731]GLY33442.1 hypothetical protein Kisp02_68070 [Kineosporia sp. NBRC 101731]
MREMKIDFFKASASADNNACVEMGLTTEGTVLLRDSKQHGQGPVLEFTPGEIAALIDGAKRGEFNKLLG